MHFSYERYLQNTLRTHFKFEGTPIRLEFRGRGGHDAEEKEKEAIRERAGQRS